MRLLKICFLLISLSALGSCVTYNDRVVGKVAAASKGEYTLETLVYDKKHGLEADFFRPEKGENFPLVVLILGGGWARGSRQQMTSVAEKFVKNNFAVFNISYRFAPKHLWPAQREDIENALEYVLKNSDKLSIDSQKIAAFGYSAGAHLALMLAYHPDREKIESVKLIAVAGGGSPVDLTAWPDGELVVKLIGGPYKTHSEKFKEASPLFYVRPNLPPTYLYHGKRDWIVEVDQSQKLLKALEKVGVEARYKQTFFGHVATFLFDDSEVESVIKFFQSKT